jgi:hypothetical protein
VVLIAFDTGVLAFVMVAVVSLQTAVVAAAALQTAVVAAAALQTAGVALATLQTAVVAGAALQTAVVAGAALQTAVVAAATLQTAVFACHRDLGKPEAWGYKEMSSILADPMAPSYMSPNAGGREGSCGISANEFSCSQEP